MKIKKSILGLTFFLFDRLNQLENISIIFIILLIMSVYARISRKYEPEEIRRKQFERKQCYKLKEIRQKQ